jgi:glycosyltransferase involved in cell wall biosynthesis
MIEQRREEGSEPLATQEAEAVLPLVSIVTPCRNSASTIDDTINSVAQAHAALKLLGHSLEHIIIDGESKDGTVDIVEKYIRKNKSGQLVEEPPKGIYSAMNLGLRLASGYFTHILNSDDMIIDPRRYAKLLVDGLIADADALIGSIAYLSNSRNPKPIRRWTAEVIINDDILFKRKLKKGLHYPHPAFIAKTCIYKAKGFDEKYSLAADYKLMQEILLRMTQREKVIIKTEPMVGMRVGGATAGFSAILKGMEQIREINRELGITEWTYLRYIRKIVKRIKASLGPSGVSDVEELLSYLATTQSFKAD